MPNQQTMSILYSLKLYGMAQSLEKRLADSKRASLSHDEFVGLRWYRTRRLTATI